ncbi:MAG TPA: PBP1A family penicillin-binding protein [Gaiellaceae bacterium]|nr:PBP1A family penicillin-binding protein [Gaiellaceae bacterium]
MTPPPRGGRPRPEPAANNRRRRARRRARAARKRRYLLLGIVLAAVGIAITTAAVGGAAAIGSNCDLASLRPVSIGQNSFVYAADGSLLGTIPAEKNRQPVPLKSMSQWLPKATIAIEDRRFYEHGGVDFEGIVRALVEDIKAGKVVQGGSTITQQLVRNLYPVSNERTVERKVKEACLAIKLNRQWSKDRILAGYLNQVYYGGHAYGVEAAAQTFFSKRARNLTLVEAALIAGLPQAPSQYDPIKNPERAIARRNEVLGAMLANGDITEPEYRAAVAAPLRTRQGRLYTRIREPYFFSYVLEELNKAYGARTVRSGGLRVYTTVSRKMQIAARKAIVETLPYKDDPAAALVAIDPGNGHIRAMVAVTPGKKGNQFNLASDARRQAGSTFKTFVLTAAIAEGISPSTSYVSAPFKYDPAGDGDCDADPPTAWCPETYDHSYIGVTSIHNATLRSDNSVYARLTLDVGPEKVAAMARKLGVRSTLPIVPSLGLGAGDVSPLEMSSAYATLAAGGVYSRPTAIRRVVLATGQEDKDAGWGKVERERVIPAWVAYEVTKILEDNIEGGTGYPNAFIGRPAAGKTGTTDDFTDAWFCGYLPNLQATVWVGYPKGKISMENIHGIRVAGGTFPAEIWGKFMRVVTDGRPVAEWHVPNQEPVWTYHTLQYAMEGAYYSAPSDSSDESTTTGEQPAEPPPATTEEQAPAPAPTPPATSTEAPADTPPAGDAPPDDGAATP